MARPQSKILSVADKKIAKANLVIAIKTHAEHIKAVNAEHKAASKVLADALKIADARLKDAAKKSDKEVSDANKAFALATRQHEKLSLAAAKGKSKLDEQLSGLSPAPASAEVTS